MTKPFEPVDPILFYMADDHLEEDVYMSKGRYRRYWWESKRLEKLGTRKQLKRMRLKLTRLFAERPSIGWLRKKESEGR